MKQLFLTLIAMLVLAAPAAAQTAMGVVPMVPNAWSMTGFTATPTSQVTVPAASTGPTSVVVRTFIWIYNYAQPDYNNATLWVTFGKSCEAGVGGAIQITAGDSQVFGGVRSQGSAQNVPQTSINVCTATGQAVGGVSVQ